MKIYINPNPRTVAIVSSKYVLLIRDPVYKSQFNENDKKCIVEFIELSQIDFTNFVELKLPCLGILGITSINDYSCLVIITKSLEIASLRPKEKMYSIQGINVICLNSNEDINESLVVEQLRKFLLKGQFYFSNSFDLTNNLQNRNLQNKDGNDNFLHFNKKFLWNKYFIEELISFTGRLSKDQLQKFHDCRFLSLIIRGYVQTVNCNIDLEIPDENDEERNNTKKLTRQESLVTLISKISIEKNGKIFGPNGLDDEGNVSNYVESEIIFYNETCLISYVIVQGNPPIYFEVDNQLSSSLLKKLQINRPFDATQESFKKHFDSLVKTFGDVNIINIYSPNNKIEYDLFRNYYEHYYKLIKSDIKYKEFLTYDDFHYSMSELQKNQIINSQILQTLKNSIYEYAALCYDNEHLKFLNKQSGVFRLGSFNHFDKCNEICKIITKEVLFLALREIYNYEIINKNDQITYNSYFSKLNDELWSKIGLLWNSNNEIITTKILNKYNTEFNQVNKKSNIYNNNDSSKKNHFFDNFTNLTISTSKKIKNLSNYRDLLNDLDKRNTILSIFLGKINVDTHGNIFLKVRLFDPFNDYINNQLKLLKSNYISDKNIKIFTGTFNVNSHKYDGNVSQWIFPENSTHNYDIIFIGLQEIVELTANQMLNIDNTNRIFWENKLLKTLNMNNFDDTSENKKSNTEYILLWSGQLGGLLSLLYVKKEQTEFVNRLEISMKKTGFGGISANKGGIAISFQYSNTSFCFLTAHLAAGLNNIEERHNNYKTLSTGLRFSENRTIKTHENIIWIGDFNYRIELTNEEVRPLIKLGKFDDLFEYDQLNLQMRSGESFPYYEEYKINFRPTYKFNLNEDIYDLSEKMRIPAWCDRILSRGKNLQQLNYNACFDIRFSDHRPVYGVFDCNVELIDETIKSALTSKLYNESKNKFGDIGSFILSNDLSSFIRNEETHDESDDDGGIVLPPPSSEKQKWWLNNGMLARVELDNYEHGKMTNLKKAIKPFENKNEPYFI